MWTLERRRAALLAVSRMTDVRVEAEIEQAGDWEHLTTNFLDKWDALNRTAEQLTRHGLSFLAAEKLHGAPVVVGA